MADRFWHVGSDAFLAQRDYLLAQYDKAKRDTADDPVKTAHGVAAERYFRVWLERFLPKRFGVCKGYIITCNPEYSGPLEEWDILIYDVLESPVLYIRAEDGGTEKRAIPVEHVRAVIEAKATFNPASAKQVADKLLRLDAFMGSNASTPDYPMCLCEPFVCAAVFFESKGNTRSEFRSSLDNLSAVLQRFPQPPFLGLILRAAEEAGCPCCIQQAQDKASAFSDMDLRVSSPFPAPWQLKRSDRTHVGLWCPAFHSAEFSKFVFDLLQHVKGRYDPTKVSSLYGIATDARPQDG